MSMKEGRIGKREGLYITALAVAIGALFSLDTDYAYMSGSSAYVTIPIAIGLSLLVALFMRRTMHDAGCSDVNELFAAGWGRAGILCALMLAAGLLYCAYVPLIRFLEVMSNFIYVDAEGRHIASYLVPAVAFIAVLGLEAQGRSARLYAPLFLLSLMITVFTSSKSFETYRLFPVMTTDGADAAAFMLSSTVLFIPPLVGTLIVARGLHGVQTAGRLASWAALVGGVVTAVLLVSLSLAFTYAELADMSMPLAKLNSKIQQEIGIVRLDKLAIFVWLGAAMLASAWEVYLAALVYARAFGQRDVRPAVLCFSALLLGACVLGEGAANMQVQLIVDVVYMYGGVFLAGILLLCTLTAFIRARIGNRRSRNA